MKVQRKGRSFTVEVSSDGEGLLSHAGTALLAGLADRTGLIEALQAELAGLYERSGGHDPGQVICDLAVMLADGGDALADLGVLREQAPLFGEVASDATAYRLVERIADADGGLGRLRTARGAARERAWDLGVASEGLTIDLDATLVGAHSEKEGAAGNFKGGFGFHPMLAYFDETSEAPASKLRPGNAGANTAADQIEVASAALGQIPRERRDALEICLRADTAGAAHELLDWAREQRICFSVGFPVSEAVREAIESVPGCAWRSALEADGSRRPNGQVADITRHLDLSSWPAGSRVIVRRERAHPGAQLSLADKDGLRFQAILTDGKGSAAKLERRHRARARAEDRIRTAKQAGMAKLPFRSFAMNEVWLELVGIACDLLAWTGALTLEGELASCEPKRLRYRVLHLAGRLSFSGRRARLRLAAGWPWGEEIVAAFKRLEALPEPAG